MEPTLAEIRMFAGNFAPRSWALCEGQLLPINQNQALFSLLGTIYGGDGRTTFALPDLRGRVPIQQGTGPGLSNHRQGAKGGSETNILNVNQIPAHNHAASGKLRGRNGAGDDSNPGGGYFATASTDLYADSAAVDMGNNSATVTMNNTGGNQPVNNVEPYLAINYIIALQGIFPSRS